MKKWDIPFVTPTHGIFVFARLGKTVGSAVEEKAFFNRLAVQEGVRVGHGRLFCGVETEFGWARVRFGLGVEEMAEAVRRIGRFLEREG